MASRAAFPSAAIGLARSLAAEPYLVGQSVRLACLAFSCSGLQRVLAQHSLPKSDLTTLLKRVAEAENAPVEIINLRVNSLGLTDKPQYTEQAFAGEDSAHAIKGERNAYVPETTRFARMPVYDGRRLRHGNRLTGPAIIEEVTTSVFVSGSYDCVVDRYGSFALYQRGREDLAGRTTLVTNTEAFA